MSLATEVFVVCICMMQGLQDAAYLFSERLNRQLRIHGVFAIPRNRHLENSTHITFSDTATKVRQFR
jgi:hypothetical protein